MRDRTRNVLIALLAVAVLLLALGAVPSLLRSGDPYYLTATVDGEWTGANASATAGENGTDEVGANATAAAASAIDASGLSERRYPYATAALDRARPEQPGRSAAYWRGPFGIKESFTHSPFDELTAIERQNPAAVTEDGVYVHDNETLYLLAIEADA